MRVLGIETSSRRGSVALVESGAVALSMAYEGAGQHAERLLPLVEEALAVAGFSRSTLDRVGVGVGPGSFTGLRVGIALGQGIGVGLGRPVLGVNSLRAMCFGLGTTEAAPRCALLDARRDEVFAAAYDARNNELAPPQTVARGEVAAWIRRFPGAIVVGEIARELELGVAPHTSGETDLPHAASVALLALELDEGAAPAEPVYVRPADAIRPKLPRSPLSSREPT